MNAWHETERFDLIRHAAMHGDTGGEGRELDVTVKDG